MRRTFFLSLGLALAALSAAASPSLATTRHSSASCASAYRHTRSGFCQVPKSKPHHRSPVEVGRAAGLQIRGKLARSRESAAARAPKAPSYPEPRNLEIGQSAHGQQAEIEKASILKSTRRVPTPLYGSAASLERQNDKTEADDLERIEDESDLAARIANKLLVPVPESAALAVNANLSSNHRYCRPWTARFLSDLARAHAALFHRPLEVSSAVRTVEYQKQLMQINGNAAAAEGDIVSPHLTGATIDIAKEGLTRSEFAWMRTRLAALELAGKIDVEEEFLQACFHITVYKSYVPLTASPMPSPMLEASQPAVIRHKAALKTSTARNTSSRHAHRKTANPATKPPVPEAPDSSPDTPAADPATTTEG